MKVYESSHPTKGDYKKVPQIKIKNTKLLFSGFEPGKEFIPIYQRGKIILILVENIENSK